MIASSINFNRNCNLVYLIWALIMINSTLAILATMLIPIGGVGYWLSILYLETYGTALALVLFFLGYRWLKLVSFIRKNELAKISSFKKTFLRAFMAALPFIIFITFFIIDLRLSVDFSLATGPDIINPVVIGAVLMLFAVRIGLIAFLIFSFKLKPDKGTTTEIVNRAKNWHALTIVATYFIAAALLFVLYPNFWPLLLGVGIFFPAYLFIGERKYFK